MRKPLKIPKLSNILQSGRISNARLRRRKKHRFKINPEANQFVKIEVAEKSCDVEISLRSPDDVNLLEYIDVKPSNGVETVSAAASEAGIYELRIISYGKRSLIAADGILQYIPFASLPVPKANAKSGVWNPEAGTRFLIEADEVVNLSSASSLSVLRREVSARVPRKLWQF